MWENRDSPILYSSPVRELVLDCSGTLSQILVGVYSIPGDENVMVHINSNISNTSFCTVPPMTPNFLDVYECDMLSVEVTKGNSIEIFQRYSTSQIGFIHDNGTDIPLVSINISEYSYTALLRRLELNPYTHTGGGCNSTKFLTEEELRCWIFGINQTGVSVTSTMPSMTSSQYSITRV